MRLLVQLLCTFIAIFTFGVYLEVPKRYLVWGGTLGVICNFVYLVLADQGIVMATLLGTLVTAVVSHIYARVLKGPVIVFLIPGILPVVPGVFLFRTVYEFFFGMKELAYYNLLMTLELAGAIALSIFIVDSVFYLPWWHGRGKRKA